MSKTAVKPTPDEKHTEGKKAAKKASNKKLKNKLHAEAKKLSDKLALEVAAELPAGKGNAFLQGFHNYTKAKQHQRTANKIVRDARNHLKSFKVDMRCFDRVFKISEMDAGDVAAMKATEALYEKQIGLALSADQKDIIKDIEIKRENARAMMSDLHQGETGKEVGTGNDSPIGHNSGNATPEQIQAERDKLRSAFTGVPEKNEKVGKGFRVPESASTAAH